MSLEKAVLVHRFHLWSQNSLHFCGHMLGIWTTSSQFPSWYSPHVQDIGLLKVALLSAALLSYAPSWVSSCHSDTGKHWQACRLPLGVSAASRAPPLTITVRVLCVGSCLLVTSQTGPCLTVSHSLKPQTDTTEQNTSLLLQTNQAKGPNYQSRILLAFSSRTYFSLPTLGH